MQANKNKIQYIYIGNCVLFVWKRSNLLKINQLRKNNNCLIV